MFDLNDTNADAIAERFKALGDPMRLRLLRALRDGECSVGDLAGRIGGGQANVSKHLQVLFQQGYVDRRKDGTMTTESVVMRASSGTVRWVKGEHRKGR